MKLSVIDLFAGCGGLGEGFFNAGFDVAVSVEKDKWAAQTLRTRHIYRKLKMENRISIYWDYVIKMKDLSELYEKYPDLKNKTEQHVIEKVISYNSRENILKIIENTLKNKKINDLTGIIGGPPCQLYSIIGRARYSNMKDKYYRDPRRKLFEHYLYFLDKLKPCFFLFENVTGMASSKLKGKNIVEILFNKFSEHGYFMVPWNCDLSDNNYFNSKKYILNSADFGVPQTRKRIIITGFRNDIWLIIKDHFHAFKKEYFNKISFRNNYLNVRDAISDLPPLKPGEGNDRWYCHYNSNEKISAYADLMRKDSHGVMNHRARTHMESDLERYRFFIENSTVEKKANLITLKENKPYLLPSHKNLDGFLNRFRVQIWDEPSTTITSHMASDGHYYIHPDIKQCRSFTVREAARCQSFPDNYFFEGPRTEQFRQVGNAVPPLMAFHIASIIKKVIKKVSVKCSPV